MRIRELGTQPLGLTFGSSLGIQALNIVSGVLLARTLGPEGRGGLAAAILLPALLAAVGSLGLSEAATYYVARRTLSLGTVIGTVVVLTVGLSIVLVGLGVALIPLFLSNYDAALIRDALLFLSYIPLYLFTFHFTGILNGLQHFGRSNVLRCLVIILTVVSLVALALAHELTVRSAVFVYIASNAITAVVAWLLVSRAEPSRLSFDRRLSRNLVLYGLKTHTSAVSALVNERIDQLAISLLLGPAKLGLYVIAVTLTSAITLIGSSVGMVALPVIAHMKEEASRRDAGRNFVTLTLILGATVSAVTMVFTPQLIHLFFGDAFAGATTAARVLLVAAVFFSVNRVVGNILKAVNRPLDAGLAEIIAMAVTVAGLAVLLPTFGITGAAIASLLAYVVATSWMAYRAGRALEVAPAQVVLPPLTQVRRAGRVVHTVARDGFRRCRDSATWFTGTALLAIAAGAAVVVLGQYAWFSFGVLVFLLVLTTVGALVINARVTGDALSLLGLAASFYLIGFAFAAIYYWVNLGPLYGDVFPQSQLTEAVGLALMGWLAIAVGYILNPLKLITRSLPRPPQLSAASPVGVVVALSVLGWPARLLLIATGRYFHTLPISSNVQVVSTGSSWFVSMLSLLPTLALAFLGAHTFQHRERTRQRKAFWALLAVEIGWYLPTGERGSIVGLALIVLLVRYYSHTRRLPWRAMLVIGVLLVFFVLPFGILYRGNNRTYQLQPRAALSQAFHDISRTIYDGPGPLIDEGFTAAFTRFSDVASLALITERGRETMALKPGETFRWAVEGFVPRALVPTKDDPGQFGNRFGRAYGVVNADNYITSIAPSQVGEFYLNFGLLGILLGMPLVGALYRLINDYLRPRAGSPFVLALYALAAWPFISGLETIVALGLIGVIKMLIFLGGILLIVGKILAAQSAGGRVRSRAARAVG